MTPQDTENKMNSGHHILYDLTSPLPISLPFPCCGAVWGDDGTLRVEPYWKKEVMGEGAGFEDLEPHSTSSSVILFTAHS